MGRWRKDEKAEPLVSKSLQTHFSVNNVWLTFGRSFIYLFFYSQKSVQTSNTFFSIPLMNFCLLRGDIQKKKRDFFPNVGPPPTPSPPFGNPCFQKRKVWFILHCRPLGAFLVFTKMFTFWSNLLLGIGDPSKKSLFLLLGSGDGSSPN